MRAADAGCAASGAAKTSARAIGEEMVRVFIGMAEEKIRYAACMWRPFHVLWFRCVNICFRCWLYPKPQSLPRWPVLTPLARPDPVGPSRTPMSFSFVRSLSLPPHSTMVLSGRQRIGLIGTTGSRPPLLLNASKAFTIVPSALGSSASNQSSITRISGKTPPTTSNRTWSPCFFI